MSSLAQKGVRFRTDRPAAGLVCLFKNFRSRVVLRLGNHVANARSILGILLLSATFNTQIEIQASGEDEDSAIAAAEVFFQNVDEEAAQQLRVGTLPGKPTHPAT
jgi:phosphotransferase system HPr (HPr) family protein